MWLSKSQFELGYNPPQEQRKGFRAATQQRPSSIETWEYAKKVCTETFSNKPHLQSLMGRVFLFLDPESNHEFDLILENHLRHIGENRQAPGEGNNFLTPSKISLFMEKWNEAHNKPSYPFFYIQRQNSPELWEMFGAKKTEIKSGWSKIRYYEHYHNYPSFINKISGDSRGINLLSFLNVGYGDDDVQKYARQVANCVTVFADEVIRDITVCNFLQSKFGTSSLNSFEYEHDQYVYSFTATKKRLYVQEPELPHIMFQIRKQ